MAKQAIEDPVINSLFSEPTQHFSTTDSGKVTPDTVPGHSLDADSRSSINRAPAASGSNPSGHWVAEV